MEKTLMEPTVGSLGGHRRVLGFCWLLYGIFRLMIGIWLVLFNGTATVMFGALLGRVPNPFALMSDFHVLYTGLEILSVFCGIFGVLAGLALLTGQRPARTLALVAALLSISEIPFGTTLGIYTLVLLLPLRDISSPIRS
jgi:hypothetical protein